MVPYVSHLDIPDDLLANCGGGSSFFDRGGLCCPDDPLDTVMENLGVADDAFLEALGIQVDPSPPPVLMESEAVLPTNDDDVYGLFPLLMDTDTGLARGGLPFPVDARMVPIDMASDGGLHGFGGGEPLLPPLDVCGVPFPVDDMVLTGLHEPGLSPAPADAALWASPACTESLAVCPSPSTTWATEVLPALFPLLELDFVVPRKNRSTPANRRRNKSWSPKPNFLLDDAPRTNNNPVSRWRRGVPRLRNRQSQRVCSHCERSDTPQWRAGPKGPGTLCNACGIRYGMGKLHDEYRPTTSPTFRSDKHSNRHRKVMKLKANKEAIKLQQCP